MSKIWLAFGLPDITWITEAEGWSTDVAYEVADATPLFAHDPTLRALLFDLVRKIGSSIGKDRFARTGHVRWAKLVQNVVTYPIGSLEELYGDDEAGKAKARREFPIAMMAALTHLIPAKAASSWAEPEIMRVLGI